jgi:hypothetical protein
MLEFSEEGVLCWKAIQKFRAAPGEAAARELYAQFIAEGAPQQVCGVVLYCVALCGVLWCDVVWCSVVFCGVAPTLFVLCRHVCLQVNLSHHNVSGLLALLNSAQPDAVIWNTAFNNIEKELVHMLEADTYGRFKMSPLFVR